jgi:hypothetical protein
MLYIVMAFDMDNIINLQQLGYPIAAKRQSNKNFSLGSLCLCGETP